jgi:hypothetical protein
MPSDLNQARTRESAVQAEAWFRSPILLLALGLLAAVIIASIATLTIALNRPDYSVVEPEEAERIKLEMRAQASDEKAEQTTSGDRDRD